MRFLNRTDAGRQLVGQLTRCVGRSDVIWLGASRGGIPVAHEAAARLNAPLDVFLVRKLECRASHRENHHEELPA
jgi:putative phosphoribosyl transferase